MGNSASRNGASKSKEIDIALENDRIKQSMNYKVLILGSGGSGKSTIMKQMKLIYGEGFENSLARQIYKKQIVCNILESMQAILGVMSNFSDDYKYQTTEEHIKGRLRSFHDEQDAQELIATIQELWKDPKIQQAYGQCKNRLHESTEYFMDRLSDISRPDFVPTDEDCLRTRVKTTGIHEETIKIGEYTYTVIDVGGQRSERKKWINCFSNVSGIFFVIGASEYDQVIIEDGKTNRMDEALAVFRQIINNKLFAETEIILFINKIDLLAKKLNESPLKSYLPDYKGGSNSQQALEAIRHHFQKHSAKKLSYFNTCATDTASIAQAIKVISSSILTKQLEPLTRFF